MSKEETVRIQSLFKPRDYQEDVCRALEHEGYKKLLLIWPRRSGKDLVAWNLMYRQALKRVGNYFYCLPTYRQSKSVIWNSISNDGKSFKDYIPKQLIKNINNVEMSITLINGSQIKLIGSDTYDTSLIGTNPIFIVFSEFALSEPNAYKLGARPILNGNDGTVMVISCVNPDTLVIANDGIRRIKDISKKRDTYSDLNKPIYGLGGFHNAEQFYYGGVQKTLKITTASGYSIECTPIHPLWNGSEWVKSKDIKIGDSIPIQYGQNVFGKGLNLYEYKYKGRIDACKNIDLDLNSADFFYLLGLIHADGSYDKNKICITNKKDPEIHDWLKSLGFAVRTDGIHHEYSSRILCGLLEYLEFKHKAKNKTFPEKLFKASKTQLIGFLQGLFDGDGTSNSSPAKKGYVKITSASKPFIDTLQVVLLNLGIASSVRKEYKEPTKLVNVASTIYNLEIYSYFAHVFYETIGFRLQRKQKNKQYITHRQKTESGNLYPVDPERLKKQGHRGVRFTNTSLISRRCLSNANKKVKGDYFDELLKEKFYYNKIVSIEESESQVFDFVIPETHSFFSNGFISHNTPRGRNALWDLYTVAQVSDDWFCQKLTLDDTKHISQEAIDREIESGEISAELAAQEYGCSFTMGTEGAYYSKYIDKLRLAGQIGVVPYEPQIPVNTAWDLGLNDKTVVILFQIDNKKINIIDYIEGSDQGLEYYIKELKSKPYVYGKHIAPHDIQVREWAGGGITRIQKARQLGIDFIVAPRMSVEDGIESVRTILPRTWIDEKKCAPLIKSLENYRREYDVKNKVYKHKPLHDAYSDAADAIRYLAITVNRLKKGASAEDIERRYQEARQGYTNNLPPFFR